jgi:hypothetical protein
MILRGRYLTGVSSDELLLLLKERFGDGKVKIFSGGADLFSIEDPLGKEKYEALSLEAKRELIEQDRKELGVEMLGFAFDNPEMTVDKFLERIRRDNGQEN